MSHKCAEGLPKSQPKVKSHSTPNQWYIVIKKRVGRRGIVGRPQIRAGVGYPSMIGGYDNKVKVKWACVVYL